MKSLDLIGQFDLRPWDGVTTRACLLKAFIFMSISESVFSVLCSGRLGYVRQRAEWRRAGEKEENFTGAAGCTLMIALLLPLYCFCTIVQTCIPFQAHLTTGHTTLSGLYEITPFSAIDRNVLHWAYTLTWLLIWYQENRSAVRLSFCCFCWLSRFFLGVVVHVFHCVIFLYSIQSISLSQWLK